MARPTINRAFCVAPMLDCTDRHARYLQRLISARALLFTEMVTTGAILFGDKARHLDFDSSEHPVALQLGGSEPEAMSECAAIAEQWGYDEVNINVGCPSDRVQSGAFGACLMQTPQIVADNIVAMRAKCSLPVTVKCRIGVDEQEPREALWQLVSMCADAGCETFYVHARKAWLKGLSPKQNRDIPPLDYELVYKLKEDFPQLEIILNGGINSLDEAQLHLDQVDGVMLGREFYANPFILNEVDDLFFGVQGTQKTRDEVLQAFYAYAIQELEKGTRLNHITRHAVGLYQGEPRSRLWRRHLSENAHRRESTADVLLDAHRAMVHA
ncbi:MAG: tRNA dihydrouridine(20/20a) synthase DusA [Pseudomonadota bacterium]